MVLFAIRASYIAFGAAATAEPTHDLSRNSIGEPRPALRRKVEGWTRGVIYVAIWGGTHVLSSNGALKDAGR